MAASSGFSKGVGNRKARRIAQWGPRAGGGTADPLAGTIEDFAHNLVVGTELRRARGPLLARVEDLDLVMRLVGPPDGAEPGPARDATARQWRAYVRRTRGRAREPRPPLAPVASNLEAVGDLLALDDSERRVLLFLVALFHSRDLRELADCLGEATLPMAAGIVGAAVLRPGEAVLRALAPDGRLAGSGLVSTDSRDSFSVSGKFDLKLGLMDLVFAPGLDRDRLVARYLPEAPPPSLTEADFAHLEEPVRLAREILGGALRARRRGVNLLFHGATGTGKTELARLLAARLGVRLYAAGKADDNGESPLAAERLSSLQLGQRLVMNGSALLLFDEVEDLFRWEWPLPGGRRGTAHMSKQWFNDLLENNPAPTIWISNGTAGMDEAFLRRFMFSVAFPRLCARQRARVLERHAAGVLPAGAVDALARRFDASPAQFAGAVAAARLADGAHAEETVARVLSAGERLLTGKEPPARAEFDAAAFRPEALNASREPRQIADRLADWRPDGGVGLTLCLHGPPGTGKSEFARYLAWRMGRRVVCRRGSDLLSMWVGGTEQNIAEAFREAEADGALLLFDEVDSLLRDRAGALRSWEASQTNEFLQQLEAFGGVVVCTTNLVRDLDPAALRRFVFKVEFRPLRPEQALLLLGDVAPPGESEASLVRARLERLGSLTPGDFAAVRRRLRALGRGAGALEFVGELEEECRARMVSPRVLGFEATRQD